MLVLARARARADFDANLRGIKGFSCAICGKSFCGKRIPEVFLVMFVIRVLKKPVSSPPFGGAMTRSLHTA